MAGGKMSPRQKMINMMYLVLMALLALNVSKEILKSFHLFEQSFNNAAKNIDSKNTATMGALQKQMTKNPGKTKPYFDRATEAQKIADSFVTYMKDLKGTIEGLYGGDEARDEETGEMLAADQMEKHANYFGPENQNMGVELQQKINDTRKQLLDILKPDPSDSGFNISNNDEYDKAFAACQLWAEDGEGEQPGTWVNDNLVHVPSSGVMAIFSRITNDAKTLEADVLEKLAARVDATDYKFDKLEAKILASATSVMKGEPYEADILLVASNSKGTPIVKVGGSEIKVEGGVGKFSASTAGSTGSKTYSGEIVINGPEGEKSFPFEGEYQVFAPSASIAADEMNLLYIGINNPLTISASGFSDAQINVRASGANLSKLSGVGKYNVKVARGNKEAIISVTTKDGKNLGKQKFRIRSLPQPVAQLGGIPNDGLPKGRASVGAQTSIIASMGAGFAYNLKYRITGFKMIMAYKRRPPVQASSGSGALTGQMRNLIKSAKPGDRILIEGIRATEATYGFKANLSPIIITIR